MEYFRLDHPPGRLILCNRSNCEDIADFSRSCQLRIGSVEPHALKTTARRTESTLPESFPSSR